MKTSSAYHGEFIVNPDLAPWTDSDSFYCNMSDMLAESVSDLPPEEDPEYGIMLSLPRQAIGADEKLQEWQVFKDGKWVDSVLFSKDTHKDDVVDELINVDQYPQDIVVLPIKKIK